MPVGAKDFLKQAEKSLMDESNEISLRCAIRNAYYAAYHRALDFLETKPVAYANCGVHQSLISYLEEEAHNHEEKLERRSSKRLSLKLGQMKAARISADYDLLESIDAEMASLIFKQSKSFFELCDELANDSAA